MPFASLADLTETAPYKKNLTEQLRKSTNAAAPFVYFEGFSLGAHYGPLLIVGKLDGGLLRKVKDSGAKIKSSGKCQLPSGGSTVKFLVENGDVNAGKLNKVFQAHKVGMDAEIVGSFDAVPSTNGTGVPLGSSTVPLGSSTVSQSGGKTVPVDLQITVMKRWKKMQGRNEVALSLATKENQGKLQLASKGFSIAAKGNKWEEANKLLDFWSGVLDQVESTNKAGPAETNRKLAIQEAMKEFPALKQVIGLAVNEASEPDKLLLGKALLQFETLEKGEKTTPDDIRLHFTETRKTLSEVEARNKELKLLKEAEDECKKTLIKGVGAELKNAQEDVAVSPEDKKMLGESGLQFKKLLAEKAWIKLRDELKEASKTIKAVQVRTEERRKLLKAAEEDCAKLSAKLTEDIKKADEDENVSADDKKVLDQVRQELAGLAKRQDWLDVLPAMQKLPDPIREVEQRTAERKRQVEALRKEMATLEKKVNETIAAAARKDGADLKNAWKTIEDLAAKVEIVQATEALNKIPPFIEKLEKAIAKTRDELAVGTKATAKDELEKQKLAIEAKKKDRIDKAQQDVADAEQKLKTWDEGGQKSSSGGSLSNADKRQYKRDFDAKITEAKERVETITQSAETTAAQELKKAEEGLENREQDLQQWAGELARDFSPDEVDKLFKSVGPNSVKELTDKIDGTKLRELFDASGSGAGVALLVRAVASPAALKGLLDDPGPVKLQALGKEFGEEGLKTLHNQLKGKKLGELAQSFTATELKELQDKVGLPKLKSLGNEFAPDKLLELHKAAGPKLDVLTNAFDTTKLNELQKDIGTEKLKALAEGFKGEQLKKLCDGVDGKALKALAGRDDAVYTLTMLLPLAKKEKANDLVDLLAKADGPRLKSLLETANKYKQELSELKAFLGTAADGDKEAFGHYVSDNIIGSCRVTPSNPKPVVKSEELETLMDVGRVTYVYNSTPQMQDGTYFDEYKVSLRNKDGTVAADDDWIIHIHKGKNAAAQTSSKNEGHMKRVSERFWGKNNPNPTERTPFRGSASDKIKVACAGVG